MMQFQIQLCLYKSCPPTLVRTAANTASLFISTKFSQVMSRIQRNGFGATPFKSKDAPPFEESNFLNLLTVFCVKSRKPVITTWKMRTEIIFEGQPGGMNILYIHALVDPCFLSSLSVNMSLAFTFIYWKLCDLIITVSEPITPLVHDVVSLKILYNKTFNYNKLN